MLRHQTCTKGTRGLKGPWYHSEHALMYKQTQRRDSLRVNPFLCQVLHPACVMTVRIKPDLNTTALHAQAPAHAKASNCHPTCSALCGAVLLEVRPMMKDASLNLNPAVLLANALSAFALNLVRVAVPRCPRVHRCLWSCLSPRNSWHPACRAPDTGLLKVSRDQQRHLSCRSTSEMPGA